LKRRSGGRAYGRRRRGGRRSQIELRKTIKNSVEVDCRILSTVDTPVGIPQLPNIDSNSDEGIDNKNYDDENEGGESTESVQEENN
jgi:hypothetical protein